MSFQVMRNAEPRPQQQNTTSGLWIVLTVAVVFGLILAAFSGGKDKVKEKEVVPLTAPQVKVEPLPQQQKVEQPKTVQPEPIKPTTAQGDRAVIVNGNNNSVHIGDVHNHHHHTTTTTTVVVVEEKQKTVTTPAVTTTPQTVTVAPNPYCEQMRREHEQRVAAWKKQLGAK